MHVVQDLVADLAKVRQALAELSDLVHIQQKQVSMSVV